MRRINVLGDDMAAYYDDVDKDQAYIVDADRVRAMYATGVLHHYAIKSEQDFVRRVRRGMQGDHTGQSWWQQIWENGEWRAFLAGINEVEDRTLQDYWMRQLGAARRKM